VVWEEGPHCITQALTFLGYFNHVSKSFLGTFIIKALSAEDLDSLLEPSEMMEMQARANVQAETSIYELLCT
jgi:hypothetical protein